MKKGDLRKQEILNTAEQLFCNNGYEQTGVQEIIDKLGISKGSFYHHYISKESLLEAICSKRAEQIRSTAENKTDGQHTVIVKLDRILSGMIPLSGEKLSFLLMLIPTFRLPEGRMIKASYCEALSAQFYPIVTELLADGNSTGDLICSDPDLFCDVILSLVNRLWVQICEKILYAEENREETDLGELLRITECYRLTIERMISLPFGSIGLIDCPALGRLCEQIHTHRMH